MSPSLLRDHPQSDEGVGGAKISGAAARASQGPLGCAIIGRSETALRDWAAAYITAYRFKSERYAYKATNIDNKNGEVSTDEGKGINIFHHDKDGRWRVSIDGWSSNLAPGK